MELEGFEGRSIVVVCARGGSIGTGIALAIAAALFLLSDLSEWITGQVLAVDGGASVKPAYLDDDGLPVFVRDEALRARLRKASPRE